MEVGECSRVWFGINIVIWELFKFGRDLRRSIWNEVYFSGVLYGVFLVYRW